MLAPTNPRTATSEQIYETTWAMIFNACFPTMLACISRGLAPVHHVCNTTLGGFGLGTHVSTSVPYSGKIRALPPFPFSSQILSRANVGPGDSPLLLDDLPKSRMQEELCITLPKLGTVWVVDFCRAQ